MTLKSIVAIALGLLCAASAPASARAEATEPKQLVQETVDKVRSTVRDNKGKLSPQQLDDKLREIITPVFDFDEMSRRCLGANWKKATESERKEFIQLFSNLLAKNYLKTIREHADDSVFQIIAEKKSGDDKRIVQTKVKYDDQNASIDYRLREKQGTWRVYDVIIEGIGLVSNYRSEFAGIVQNEQMSGLLKRLREKQ